MASGSSSYPARGLVSATPTDKMRLVGLILVPLRRRANPGSVIGDQTTVSDTDPERDGRSECHFVHPAERRRKRALDSASPVDSRSKPDRTHPPRNLTTRPSLR